MAETIYPKGIRTFEARESAPEFVLGTMIINPNEFFAWVKENPDFISEYKSKDGVISKQLKLNILKSQKGGINFTVDTYKKAEDISPF